MALVGKGMTFFFVFVFFKTLYFFLCPFFTFLTPRHSFFFPSLSRAGEKKQWCCGVGKEGVLFSNYTQDIKHENEGEGGRRKKGAFVVAHSTKPNVVKKKKKKLKPTSL